MRTTIWIIAAMLFVAVLSYCQAIRYDAWLEAEAENHAATVEAAQN